MNDRGIVPPLDFYGGVFLFVKINGLLLLINGRRGLHRTAENNRHAVRDAAVDAAVMVGLGLDLLALAEKCIVGVMWLIV